MTILYAFLVRLVKMLVTTIIIYFHNLRYWRNKVTELVNKTSYYRNLIEANINVSKTLWGLLNEITPKPNQSNLSHSKLVTLF